MKPLYNITNESKETYFNLLVSDILKEIEEKANKWFEEFFLYPKDYIPNEILVRNLLDDLDYLFSEAIWVIEVAENLGFNIDFKRHLEDSYNTYTKNEYGYRYLVNHRQYDANNNILLTKRQATAREKRMNKAMIELLKKL